MKPATKILMMSAAGDRRRQRDDRDGRRDMAPDDRFRDRRGREHYDNGRYAPNGMYMYGRDIGSYPIWPPYIPPVYTPQYADDRRRDGSENGHPVNKIGFSLEGRMDRYPAYSETHHGDYWREDMEHAGKNRAPLTQETALEWISRMKNEDGTTGPHWTMEQTEQARKQRGIDCDPLEFFVTMNMMYSDYCKAAEKANASSMDFYAYMSKAFLDDKDAQPDKLERYYHCIAKK